MELGWLTTDQMIEVDRVMIEDLHIELIQMMENAGRNLARLALERFLTDAVGTGAVVVCCGPGGNGGGGLVAARHLHVAGVEVSVVLAADESRFTEVPAHQLDIIRRMGVPVFDEIPADVDLLIDAILGYSLNGDPHGRAGEIIEQVAAATAPVLSLDTPSGLDTTTGVVHEPHVEAVATMTLALPKIGLRGQAVVGELYVADISVPPSVYEHMGVGSAPDFRRSPIVAVPLTC